MSENVFSNFNLINQKGKKAWNTEVDYLLSNREHFDEIKHCQSYPPAHRFKL